MYCHNVLSYCTVLIYCPTVMYFCSVLLYCFTVPSGYNSILLLLIYSSLLYSLLYCPTVLSYCTILPYCPTLFLVFYPIVLSYWTHLLPALLYLVCFVFIVSGHVAYAEVNLSVACMTHDASCMC